MLMVTLLSDDAAYAAPPSPIITDVFNPGLELINMDVFCSGSAGYPARSPGSWDGETCTTVLFSSLAHPLAAPPVLLSSRRNSSVTVDEDGGTCAGTGGAGGGGGGGGSAGLSNAARVSGLALCLTWIRIVSLNTVTSSDPDPLPEFCLSLRLRFSFRSTAAMITSVPKIRVNILYVLILNYEPLVMNWRTLLYEFFDFTYFFVIT
jgi:hypothetical protein